jgi:L-asparaginase II
MVESVHEVHAVVVGPGDRLEVHGDADRMVFPRSAVKMVQALPLVMTGAADAFGLGDAELALACASHSGEPGHLERVRSWLARIGLDETSLECGTPAGRTSPVEHECSGKHSGFLTLARDLGIDPSGYTRPGHLVQQLVSDDLAATLGASLDPARCGIDGCGVPTHPVRLEALARGIARFGTPPATWTIDRTDAAERLGRAMRAHPWLIAGTGRLCTQLMEDTDDLIAKFGAEGVYVATSLGGDWGVALKAVDGARRAAELAVLHLVEASGRRLSDRLTERRVIRSTSGADVGRAEVADVVG